MSRIFLFLLALTSCAVIQAQVARIQIIHNSADTSLHAVDVYVDGVLQMDSLEYHEATPFMDITSGQTVNISFCPGNSTDASESFYTYSGTFEPAEKYVAVANGVILDTYFSDAPFGLNIFSGAMESSPNTSSTEILFCNGVTDFPEMDIAETETIQLTAFEDVGYGEFAGYLSLLTAGYQLSVADNSGSPVIGSYAAPLDQYFLGGIPVTIVSSGFQFQHLNNQGEALGLWLAKPLGGMMLQLPVIDLNLTSDVEIIHNCADLQFNMVDLYVNDELLLDDFTFRHSSGSLPFPSGQDINIRIAASNSESSEEAFYETIVHPYSAGIYTAVISGIQSATGYNPSIPFSFDFYEIEFSETSNGLYLINGCTDQPAVDLTETVVMSETWAENLAYASVSSLLEISSGDFTIEVTSGDEAVELGAYHLSLDELSGNQLSILTSGFSDPANNSGGADFGLWLSNRQEGMLTELLEPVITGEAMIQFINNCPDLSLPVVDLYMDGELLVDDLAFREATDQIMIMVGSDTEIGIAPATSLSSIESIASFVFSFDIAENYILFVEGILSTTGYNPQPDLLIRVIQDAQLIPVNSNESSLLFHHGATDLAMCNFLHINDDYEYSTGVLYGETAGYFVEDAETNHQIKLTTTGGFDIGNYALNLSSWGLMGEPVTIFTSGFINPVNNSNGAPLELWLATMDGSTMSLPLYVGVEEMTGEIRVYPVFGGDQILVEYLGWEVPPSELFIYDNTGRLMKTEIRMTGDNVILVDVSGISQGIYHLNLRTDLRSHSTSFFKK